MTECLERLTGKNVFSNWVVWATEEHTEGMRTCSQSPPSLLLRAECAAWGVWKDRPRSMAYNCTKEMSN